MNTQTVASTESLLHTPPTAARSKIDWSPPVVLQRIVIAKGLLHIAREDLLPGGTKQRAVIPFLKELLQDGVERVVYASPFCGFAQVALAVSAQALGVSVDLFCERDPAKRGIPQAHEFTQLARDAGASIHLCESLGAAEGQASALQRTTRSTLKCRSGFKSRVTFAI